MKNARLKIFVLFALCFLISGIFAQKQIYIPTFITNTGMNLNDNNSQWCYARSVQTDNYIIFWESGFGSDPSKATGNYYINMDALKICAEKSFATFVDSLRMVIKGSSLTDKYKQMIFLLYSTDWGAYGSGQDEKVGTLHVNPAAANIATVVSHEIGHCFEYMTGCDVPAGGYRYGFGTNASGGNGFWEQCAQWQAFKAYPNEQFRAGDFNEYITSNHLHIIHETPRYANYFLPDYWTFKRGQYFMGRLWRESRRPEDPVETYKRLASINQEQFNDEIYDHASRLTTWDLPAIKSYGANYIDRRAQVKMNLTTDKYWLIDPSVCIENYGYNSIKLNVPTTQTDVSVTFKGQAGVSGFRSLNIDKGGWRYGFVALLKDGTRVYSTMGVAKYTNGANPTVTLAFTCPANCSKLWLVVSGSPQEHWRHAWDDDNTNDEQWPYQVQFVNTNLLGQANLPTTTYTLKTTIVGGGTVSPASGSFAAGTSPSITATAANGYVFFGWSGDATGTDNPLSLTMNANKNITATFTSVPTYTLTTTVVGSGTVSPVSGSFNQGSVQTLTATPAAGFLFSGWSGDATGTTNPLTVTMSGNKTITATFTAMPNEILTYNVFMLPMADYTPSTVTLDAARINTAFGLTTAQIAAALGTTIIYYGVEPNGTLNPTSTANAPGHWFTNTGTTVAWSDQAYVFSELTIGTLIANIGQYPDRCKLGDKYTIKQALVYTKSATDIRQVTLVFNITIGANSVKQTISLAKGWNIISTNVHPADSSIATLFAGLNVQEIKTMEVFWRKGQTAAFNSLKSITAGSGYLVNMNSDGTLNVTGTPFVIRNPQFVIKTGWQLIGCPYQASTPFSNFFNTANCSTIKNFEGFWTPTGTTNSIQNIEPGKGYFIKK